MMGFKGKWRTKKLFNGFKLHSIVAMIRAPLFHSFYSLLYSSIFAFVSFCFVVNTILQIKFPLYFKLACVYICWVTITFQLIHLFYWFLSFHFFSSSFIFVFVLFCFEYVYQTRFPHLFFNDKLTSQLFNTFFKAKNITHFLKGESFFEGFWYLYSPFSCSSFVVGLSKMF